MINNISPLTRQGVKVTGINIMILKKKQTVRHPSGFTLIEVAIAIIIVGLSITSLMMLLSSGTTVNHYSNDMSTAVFLADQLRNMTDQVNFDNLQDYHQQSFNGVDADQNPVAGLQGYQQTITVQPINPDDLTIYIGPDPQAVLITAVVKQKNTELTRISWLRTR